MATAGGLVALALVDVLGLLLPAVGVVLAGGGCRDGLELLFQLGVERGGWADLEDCNDKSTTMQRLAHKHCTPLFFKLCMILYLAYSVQLYISCRERNVVLLEVK